MKEKKIRETCIRTRYVISTVYRIYIYIYTHPAPCLMDHKIANGRFLPFSTKSRATNNGSSPIIEKYDKKKKPQGSLSFFMRFVDFFSTDNDCHLQYYARRLRNPIREFYAYNFTIDPGINRIQRIIVITCAIRRYTYLQQYNCI